MKARRPNPTTVGQADSAPLSTSSSTRFVAAAGAAVVGVALAVAVGAPLVLRLMIGSRIEAIDTTGQWLLFTAWDIEHAAQTAPWPIQTLAAITALACLAFVVGPELRSLMSDETSGQ